MSYDITNEKGGHWSASNEWWPAVLSTANEHGWQPAGTVLYKPSGTHPDQQAVEADDGMRIIFNTTPGDTALGFEQATKSGEIEEDYYKDDVKGSYLGYDGQVITAEDAANIAKGLRKALQEEHNEDWKEWIQELIDVLEEGECRIT